MRSAPAFFLATFGLSWGAGALYMLFQAEIDAIFGPMGYTNPVFILMVYTPGIVGVAMVWHHYGLSGLSWPDAQPWDMWLFVAAALVIALVNRKALFDRSGAATGILHSPCAGRSVNSP